MSHPDKGAPRGGMLGIHLSYDPFVDSAGLKHLIRDLALGVLQGQLYPRQASTVRNLVGMWVRLDEHERLDSLEKRIELLEAREVTRQ